MTIAENLREAPLLATYRCTQHRRPRAHFAAIVALLLCCTEAIAQTPIPVVGVMPVAVEDVAPGADFVGRVEALNTVDIRARVEGFIEARPFEEGQIVREGQELFRIERPNYEAALATARAGLASAQATLRNAERALERNQVLRRTQAVSQAALEETETARDIAEANVMSAEASVRQAELNLGYALIKAPFSGRIGRAAFAVGSLVTPSSDPLARIVQMDPIRVAFSVSDRTLLELRAKSGGLSKEEIAKEFVPRLRLSSGVDFSAAGQIEFFGNEIDPQTGTIPVHARFPNPEAVLIPGQFVTIVVRPAQPQRRPVVPVGAVQLDRDGRFVLVLDKDNKVALRRITVGTQIGQNWVVEGGLEGGENLIVQGVQNARPGATVRTVQSESGSKDTTGGAITQPSGAAPR